MSETSKINTFYKSIIGDTKATIDAIQKYIISHSPYKKQEPVNVEENPAESINKILNSVTFDDETNAAIEEIIKRL